MRVYVHECGMCSMYELKCTLVETGEYCLTPLSQDLSEPGAHMFFRQTRGL